MLLYSRTLTYLLTYLLTPWCRVLLEKLTCLQLVKKFTAFHGTRRFITALTSVRHLSLSWASPIQSIFPHPTSWISILILSTHLCLGQEHNGRNMIKNPTVYRRLSCACSGRRSEDVSVLYNAEKKGSWPVRRSHVVCLSEWKRAGGSRKYLSQDNRPQLRIWTRDLQKKR